MAILAVLFVVPAMADAASPEVNFYKDQFDVSEAVAKERLQVQGKGTKADIAGELDQRLDDSYAGIWFDNSTGEFVVPVTPDTSRTAVKAEFADANLANDYRTALVQSSWTELEAAQERVNLRLRESFEDGLVQTSLDPSSNAVTLLTAGDIAKDEAAEIARIAESSDVKIDIRKSDRPQFHVQALGCRAALLEKYCGIPLRGGVEIDSGNTMCTAGFPARGDNGGRFLLTAGHCVYADNNPRINWSSKDDGVNFLEQSWPEIEQHTHHIGEVTQYYFPTHDWAKISATGYWDVVPWPTMVAYWGENKPTLLNEAYSINGEASSVKGQTVCHSGANSGTSCGEVKNTDMAVFYVGYGWVDHMVRVVGGCAKFGDSGGPVFREHKALGLVGAGEIDEEHPCNEPEWFYIKIGEATAALNVHIVPDISTPAPNEPVRPTVVTNPVSNLSESQATLNGTVNPNGWETTYHFEYGKTTGYGNSVPIPAGGAGWGTNAVPATIPINVLPRTRYHYRLAASNAGGTSYGADQAFTTGIKWNVRNSNSAGNPDSAFWFGVPGEKRVVGDWDGNGTQTPGVFNPTTGVWKLRNSTTTGPAYTTFQYGGGAWETPVVGDWNNDGIDSIGVYDQEPGNWNLKNSNSGGNPNYSFQYGGGSWETGVVGDWNKDGTDSIGVYDRETGNWNLKNSNSGGNPNYSFQYGGGPWSIGLSGDWDGDGTDSIGVIDPQTGNWNLKNSNSGGNPNYSFQHGGSQFVFVTGDWDSNGTMTPGLTHGNAETAIEWQLRNTNSGGGADLLFEFGSSDQDRVIGDWNGDGIDTVGRYNPVTGVWQLRNSNSADGPQIEFQYGGGPWVRPVAGDWNKDGIDTIGIYDPEGGTWNLRNTNSGGNPDISFQYGGGPWARPVIGDWNNDGAETIGVYDPQAGNWNLRNSNSAGNPDLSFQYGGGVWVAPIVGDWNNDGIDTIGVFDPQAGNWNLRNSNSAGNPDLSFQYGGSQFKSVVGDWDGNGTDTAGLVTW